MTRDQDTQLSTSAVRSVIIEAMWEQFKDAGQASEAFAARLCPLHHKHLIIDEITRAAIGAGRDAAGGHSFGVRDDRIYLESSQDAKCYWPLLNCENGIRVSLTELSRLISRIRSRDFGGPRGYGAPSSASL